MATFKMKFAIYSLFFLSISAQAQTITMDEFLDLLQKNHPLFTKTILSQEIEALERDAYAGYEDWLITSGPYFARRNPIPPGAFIPSRVDKTNLGAAVQRSFWKTGGQLSLAWATDITDQKLPDLSGLADIFGISEEELSGPTRYFQNNLYLTYSQPLFQNYGGELDRLGYDLSQYNVNAAEVRALEEQEDFLLTMSLKFLDWVLLSEQNIIARERKNLAAEQLLQAENKRAANLVDEVDVLRAEDAVRIAEQGLVLIEARWKGMQANLAVLTKNNDILIKNPAFDLYATLEPRDPGEAQNRIKQQSRLLKLFSIQQDQLGRQKRGLEEMVKPQLYLKSQVALKGGANEFGDAAGLDKSDVGVSLNFSYPLGNRTALKKVEKNDLQIRQIRLAEAEINLSLNGSLQNLLIQIGDFEKVLAINRQQIESAAGKTSEEIKRYNQGRGDLTFVIQSQDNEERAKLTYAQNAATYHGLNLNLKALLDELLVSEM